MPSPSRKCKLASQPQWGLEELEIIKRRQRLQDHEYVRQTVLMVVSIMGQSPFGKTEQVHCKENDEYSNVRWDVQACALESSDLQGARHGPPGYVTAMLCAYAIHSVQACAR